MFCLLGMGFAGCELNCKFGTVVIRYNSPMFLYKTIVVATALLMVFMFWLIYMANTEQDTVIFEIVRSISYGDKMGHFLLFGILSLAMNLVLKLKVMSIYVFKIYYGAVVVLFIVMIEEVSQHFVVSRTLDLMDFLASVAGILVFTTLGHFIYKRYFR